MKALLPDYYVSGREMDVDADAVRMCEQEVERQRKGTRTLCPSFAQWLMQEPGFFLDTVTGSCG